MFYLILLKAIFIKQEKYHIFFSAYKYIRSEKKYDTLFNNIFIKSGQL